MMKTQGLLRSFGNFNYSAPKLCDSQLIKTVERIRNQFGYDNVTEPERYSVEEVRLKLLAATEGQLSFKEFTRKEHRLCPWAFFIVDGGHQLIENGKLLKTYIDHLETQKLYQPLSIWLHVFLLYYPKSATSFDLLRQKLIALLTAASGLKSQQLRDWFEGNEILAVSATTNFAHSCESIGFNETFQKYRLTNSLETSQFAVLGIQKLLTELSSSLASKFKKDQKRILDSLFKKLLKQEQLKYPTLRVPIADGLLSSFLKTPPGSDIKRQLKDFFIKHYGDIRIYKTKWVGVCDTAQMVMQQWMVENTLHDFFALLTHVAKYDSTADRHWLYRKRFWNAYLKKGVISEAWVALGPTAYGEAEQFLESNTTVYASLSGAQSRHSSLIMIIDNILVTEWSHSGRYRVWDSGYVRPKLYRESYHRNELISGCDYEGNHSSSDTGGWQHKLSSLINDLTGISVTSKDYMNG